MTELTEQEKAVNHDTWTHIDQVRRFITLVQHELDNRSLNHDQSKLSTPEVAIFTKFTPRLKELTYGSEEYKQSLTEMKPALDHHYANNSHHPEYYVNGVDGMNIMDVVEMLCDWTASAMRTKDGDIYQSLEFQKDRFGISDQLINIMKNTLQALGIQKNEK